MHTVSPCALRRHSDVVLVWQLLHDMPGLRELSCNTGSVSTGRARRAERRAGDGVEPSGDT